MSELLGCKKCWNYSTLFSLLYISKMIAAYVGALGASEFYSKYTYSYLANIRYIHWPTNVPGMVCLCLSVRSANDSDMVPLVPFSGQKSNYQSNPGVIRYLFIVGLSTYFISILSYDTVALCAYSVGMYSIILLWFYSNDNVVIHGKYRTRNKTL